MTDLESWALTAPVGTELQRTLLLTLAADAVDQLAYFDIHAFAANHVATTADEVIEELEALEATGLISYTAAYQPFDTWVMRP